MCCGGRRDFSFTWGPGEEGPVPDPGCRILGYRKSGYREGVGGFRTIGRRYTVGYTTMAFKFVSYKK